MSNYRTAQEHIDAFRDTLREAGLAMTVKDDVIADGKIHRYYVDGDARGRRNGWYVYHDDGLPAGGFGRWGGIQRTWSADKDTVKPLTAEERAELAKKREERKAKEAAETAAREAHAAKRANAMWDAAKPAEGHPYLTKKGIQAHGARVGEFWKENKEGKPYLVAKDALLIPMKDCTRQIVGLQAIYATPIKVGDELRGKDFIFGARKLGVWTTIGAPTVINGRKVVGICEGYATGASAHQATGMGVVPAFDAGNLVHVAREVRRLIPDALIVILGDNDAWTTKSNGEPWNPGVEKGRDAAATVKGLFVAPTFKDVSSKPTDWNDLHGLEGLDEVNRQIMAVIDPPAPEPQPEEPPPIEEPPPAELEDYGAPGEPEPPAPEPEPKAKAKKKPPTAAAPPLEEAEEHIAENPHFTVLGHDRKHIFVYQHEKKMLTARGEAEWSENALLAIAELQWWEMHFPIGGGKSGFNKKMAINWLIRTAFRKGFFDPTRIRGRGAWRDDGRFVFHFGHKLWVDGKLMELGEIDSSYVYEQGARMRLPAAEPLSGPEGKMVYEAFQQVSWTRPASAILLAGWCALAPVSGALLWRPHAWVTGGAGSGKSTILNLVDWLMAGTDLFAQGNSTEAGIRQALRTDARPVLFDESEQNNDREEARVQNVLSLIRQSSTESAAKTLKGTSVGEAMDFVIRSMFLLSSIQVGMKQQADVERISVLNLRPKRDSGEGSAAENWKRLSAKIDALKADDELPAKLLHRSLMLLPITIQNIEVFAQAAAEKFGSQRDGDQYGTLLAGAWSLVSTKVATLEEARAMIEKYDWSEYLEGSETEESDKALAALLGSLVRVGMQTPSVYELIEIAANHADGSQEWPSAADAWDTLQRHGIRVEGDEPRRGRRPGPPKRATQIWVARGTHPGLDKLVESTTYRVDLKGHLGRVRGAKKSEDKQRFAGLPMSYIRIPIGLVLAEPGARVMAGEGAHGGG